MKSNFNYNRIFDISNLIKQMELDLNLLNDSSYGNNACYVWESTRHDFQVYLNKYFSINEQSPQMTTPIHKMKILSLVYHIGHFLYSVTIKNWVFAEKKADWLIFPHTRRKFKSGKYEDIYTTDIIEKIGAEKCVIIEKPHYRRHYSPEKYKNFHFEFNYIIVKILIRLIPFTMKYDSISIYNMINNIKIYINNKTGENINVHHIFNIKQLFANYLGYLLMLKWLKPKKILLVVSYGMEPLIHAALQLQIPTVEIQHGVITPEHLGYSVPNGMTKKTFPSYLLLFGNYWKDSMNSFPLPPERLIVFGYPYLENMLSHNNKNKIENQIVIISQDTIGEALSNFAVKLALLYKGNYNIIYKLHPSEYTKANLLYSELYDAASQGLLKIIDSDIYSLYTILLQSRWQIGVYSTAIYEGIAFGCQTILVNMPGIEHMTSLIKSGNVQLVKKPEDIIFKTQYSNAPVANYFFADNWQLNWSTFNKINLSCLN